MPDGDVGWLLATQVDVVRARADPATARNVLRIPLLTDDANREFRQYLLECRANPGTVQIGCPIVVSGHASMCHASNALGANLELPCIAVETGRSF